MNITLTETQHNTLIVALITHELHTIHHDTHGHAVRALRHRLEHRHDTPPCTWDGTTVVDGITIDDMALMLMALVDLADRSKDRGETALADVCRTLQASIWDGCLQ